MELEQKKAWQIRLKEQAEARQPELERLKTEIALIHSRMDEYHRLDELESRRKAAETEAGQASEAARQAEDALTRIEQEKQALTPGSGKPERRGRETARGRADASKSARKRENGSAGC